MRNDFIAMLVFAGSIGFGIAIVLTSTVVVSLALGLTGAFSIISGALGIFITNKEVEWDELD